MKSKQYFLKFFPIDSFYQNLFSFLIKLVFGSGRFLQDLFQPDSVDLIELESNEGKELLVNSSSRLNYELLYNNFQSQDKFNYCGVATTAIILNAFRLSFTHSRHDLASDITQKEVFEDKIKPKLFFKDIFLGLSLKDLEQLLEAYSLNTEMHYADESLGLEEFRSLAASTIDKPDSFVIVNYWRGSLNQKGWGHISPLGAYSSEIDSFLIIDVASSRYPSFWVKTKMLYSAIKVREFVLFGRPRGLLLVSRNKLFQ